MAVEFFEEFCYTTRFAVLYFFSFIKPCVEDRDYVRGGSEGALAPPEFEGSERITEGETDNPLLIAPSASIA